MFISPNDSILVKTKGSLCTITFNRPKSLNALNLDMLGALLDITTKLKDADYIRVIILQGAGDHFMAGGDIKNFQTLLDQKKEKFELRQAFENELEELHRVIFNMRAIPIPIIASVQGAVAGAGLSFMLACDLAICSENTKLTLAYRHIGASPDGGSTYFLPRIIGLKRAMEIALLSEPFGAQRALEIGLVNRIVPEKELSTQTIAMSEKLIRGPAYALGQTKQLLNSSSDLSFREQLGAETDSFINCALKNDFYEGTSAFIEKRKPNFE